MQASRIRRRFLDFFIARGHTEVPSSSLVPADDPTLLFTNAGMVQFKRAFLGLEAREYRRATTAQKCVRAGGKHNDLEQVGHTDRHLTFFEMLGNFSFGDYFKAEAIAAAWEFVTSREWLGIQPDRIRISVHHQDEEARRLWREVAGLSDERIYGLSDKDNFWQMAETGPCGPCSEIYVDIHYQDAKTRGSEPPASEQVSDHIHSLDQFVAAADAGRYVELWNLVFMQYDRQGDGTLVPLPAPSVDTGMGLERTAAVLQGERSVFHTDLFRPLIERAEAVVGGGRRYDRGPSGAPFRVLADHARAVAFLLADGVYPSNEGRGYVLRRILRRAVRHAYLLGRREPTLVQLVDEATRLMGGVYPELVRNNKLLTELTASEEERFLETIEGGLARMAELTRVSAEEAFRLYDTYGFPIDLTQIVACERGVPVDVAGFEKLLEEQRERSRRARAGAAGARPPALRRRGGAKWTVVRPRLRQRWVGYETTRAETDILAFQRTPERVGLVLRENPFYAESGGQVSDTGEVVGQGWRLPVDEVRKLEGGRTAVYGPLAGPFEPTSVEAVVNQRERRDTERNHTATHLLHAALRGILGAHVRQAGSVVAPDRLRFDFTHHQPIDAARLAAIEAEINARVWENLDVTDEEMPYRAALELGAMALFGEKYGEVVRVVTVPGVSRELCGGTHVRTTGQIGLVRLVGESGVGAGVRRLEALSGPGAFRWLDQRQRLLEEAAQRLGSMPEHLSRRVEALVEERKKLEKRVQELIHRGGQPEGEVLEVNGRKVRLTYSSDRDEIRAMVDTLRSQGSSGILVNKSSAGWDVALTDDLVAQGLKAPDLVNRLAALSGGRGGGRAYFASAGAGDEARFREVSRQEIAAVLLPGSA